MKRDAGTCLGRLVLAASLAAVGAGCGARPPVAGGEGVEIVRMESPAWNAPREPGLFRITFDARRTAEIRRDTANTLPSEGINAYTGERYVLDREADRELKARGLCSGSATFVAYIDEGDGKSGIIAIFKCRPPAF
jgi:hypothetical protein